MDTFMLFLQNTGFYNISIKTAIMLVVGIIFIYLAIKKEYEPLLLLPIGFGILIGNIPAPPSAVVGVYKTGSVMNILYWGVKTGLYPPLIFLGIGELLPIFPL